MSTDQPVPMPRSAFTTGMPYPPREESVAPSPAAMNERGASLAAGGALAFYGLRRGDLVGLLLGVLGGGMLAKGALGYAPVAHAIEGTPRERDEGEMVERSVTIERSAEDLYRVWRQMENLPRFMDHLVAVKAIDDRRSHWTAKSPTGGTVEWDAEITEDRPGEVIAWRSLPEGDVANEGVVRFTPAPGDRGTEVHVRIRYQAPGGGLGATLARLTGQQPDQQVREDLRHFKEIMEAGAKPTTEGQPSGPKKASLLLVGVLP